MADVNSQKNFLLRIFVRFLYEYNLMSEFLNPNRCLTGVKIHPLKLFTCSELARTFPSLFLARDNELKKILMSEISTCNLRSGSTIQLPYV